MLKSLKKWQKANISNCRKANVLHGPELCILNEREEKQLEAWERRIYGSKKIDNRRERRTNQELMNL